MSDSSDTSNSAEGIGGQGGQGGQGLPGHAGDGGQGGVGGVGGVGGIGIRGEKGIPGSLHHLSAILAGFAVAFLAIAVLTAIGLHSQAKTLHAATTNARSLCAAVAAVAAKDAALADAEHRNVFVPGKGGSKPEIRAARIAAYTQEAKALTRTGLDCEKR